MAWRNKAIKAGTKPNKKFGIEGGNQDIKHKILDSAYTRATKQNIIRIYDEVGTEGGMAGIIIF